MTATTRVVACALLLTGLLALPGQAQEPTSVRPATTLANLLDELKLDTIAARDPAEPDRFVAALYFPGTELLVISARYPVPVLLEQRIERRDFLEAYRDLQQAGLKEGRFFVEDLKADGLHPGRAAGEPFDLVTENTTTRTAFDGDWKDQQLSEAAYRDRFVDADRRYAKMLLALIASVRGGT